MFTRTRNFLLSSKSVLCVISLFVVLASVSFIYNTPVVVPVVDPPVVIPLLQESRTRFGLISACVVPVSPLVTSMYTVDVVQTSLLNKLDYCSRHIDTTCHLSTESSDKCNSFVWEKEFSLLRHLHLHDWLLWVDCDALMANLTQSLETVAQHAQPTDDLIVIRCVHIPLRCPLGSAP
eukprot:96484-Pyramimonas_sp.AAC.1